jgi:hypothetical protein
MDSSEVLAGAGNQQVGSVYSKAAWASFAAVWNGSAGSFRNLNPSWSSASVALATSGTQQAGYATGPGYQVHAGYWSGTAASFVDLNPGDGISSIAFAIAGNQQGGSVSYNGISHAALWSGTAASFRELGQGPSVIRAMTATLQVGEANNHAGMWFGTAESFVDLQPAGAAWSVARATTDTMQAGFAVFNTYRHALVWSGSATAYQDLQLALDPAKYRESEANSIWTDGSTVLVAGSATDWPGYSHPVLWRLTVVPEPGTASLLVVGLGLLTAVQRRRRRSVR